MSDTYKFRGDYKLKTLTLITYSGLEVDLTTIFLELNIYESIFSNTMSGSVSVIDATNMIQSLPVLGFEKIEIEFHTANKQDNSFHMTFSVYKLSKQTSISERAQGFVIHFVSPEVYADSNTFLHRSYKGTIDNIAIEIFQKLQSEHLIETEPTSGIFDCIIPAWKPFYTLNWLTKRAVAVSNNSTGYMFFQNKEGFKFLPLERMYRQRSNIQFVRNSGLTKTIHAYDSIIKKDRKTTLEKMNQGAVRSELITFDPLYKKSGRVLYKRDEHFDRKNSVSLFADTVDDPYEQPIYHKAIYDYRDRPDPYVLSSQKHRAVMANVNTNCYDIELPGDSDLTVGYTANLSIPATTSGTRTEQKRDEMYSGRVLMTDIRHRITKEGYRMAITLMKDGADRKI